MSDIYIYNTSNGELMKVIKSAHTPDYDKRSDVLVNPNLPASVPEHYLKVVAGNIVEMTAAEKAAKDSSLLPTKQQKIRDQSPGIDRQLELIWEAIDANALDKTSAFYTQIKTVRDRNK